MQERLIKGLKSLRDKLCACINQPVPTVNHSGAKILEQYVQTSPSVQNALDIFRGEWTSKLPAPYSEMQSGHALLYEDVRLEWGLSELGGVTQQNILELGPLECGHSYLLIRHGAINVTAIEANTHAYLKCLIAKDIYRLANLSLHCGDFVEYLRQSHDQWDMCVASGVLYHMTNPAELIALIAKVSKRLYIWTHYYDKTLISQNPDLAPKFSEGVSNTYQGFQHTLYRQSYLVALERQDFCGGSSPYSMWMSRDDLFSCLHHFGFAKITTAFEEPSHIHGPSLALVAQKEQNIQN